MNIRPYTDALRAAYGSVFSKMYDSRAGGGRTVQLGALFGGVYPASNPTQARQGDRWLEVQLSDDGRHRVSHMVVTRDGPADRRGSLYMRGSTIPTDFGTPEEMLAAIKTEVARTDHPEPERNTLFPSGAPS